MNDETQNQIIKSKKGEGYVSTAVKLLISIVCGSLILGSVFFIQKDTVLTTTNGRISSLFGLPLVNPLDGDSGTTPGSGDTGGGNNPGIPGSQSEWEVEGNTLVGYNGEITDGMTLIIPSEVNGTPIERVQHKDANPSSDDTTINILGTTSDTSVAAIVIEDGIQEIGDCAFAGMEGLSGTVQLPDSVTTLGNKAFAGTNITYISSNLSNLQTADDSFGSNTILSTSIILNSASGYKVEDGWVVDAPINKNGEIIIPSEIAGTKIIGVKNLNQTHYGYWTSLNVKKIIIGNGVEYIGTRAFESLPLVNEVVLPASVKEIGFEAFYEIDFKHDLILPEGLTTIGNSAFGYTATSGTHRIYLPSTLQVIDSYAFRGSEFIGDIIIPDSVTSIGDCAFDNASFNGILKLPKGLTAIPTGLCRDTPITNVIFPEGIKSIGAYAFQNTKITSVQLPSTLEVIDSMSFYYTPLEGDLYIPDSVTAIGTKAFYPAGNKLKTISYKNGVKLGTDAFYNTSATIIKR